jgi:hypothetical protein
MEGSICAEVSGADIRVALGFSFGLQSVMTLVGCICTRAGAFACGIEGYVTLE